MIDDIEPLAPSFWFSRIERIAGEGLGSLERSLRHAVHLMQLTPAPFREAVRCPLDERELEALLDAGEFDEAARMLVQPEALSLHAGDAPHVEARIRCPLLEREANGSGGTVAAAILDAWTKRALLLREEGTVRPPIPPVRASPGSRAEPRRQWH